MMLLGQYILLPAESLLGTASFGDGKCLNIFALVRRFVFGFLLVGFHT